MRLNKQNKIIVGVLALLLTLTVGYAVFSQSLNITGTAKAEGNFSLIFVKTDEKPVCSSGYSGNCLVAEDLSSITDEGKKLTITVDKLTYPSAYVKIPARIKNDGSINVKLKAIKVDGLSNDDIEVTYTALEENEIIKSKEEKDIIITVTWKEKSTNTNPEILEFTITLEYEQEINSLVESDQNTSSFPVIEGQLGDNVFYTYNNGNIAITGTGDMWDGNIVEGGYCDASFSDLEYCGLINDIGIKANEKLKTGDAAIDEFIEQLLPAFIVGHSYDDFEFTKEELETLLIDNNLTKEQASKVIEMLDSVPPLKSITIENGITSIRPQLFGFFNAKSLIITIPNTINKKSNGIAFDGAYIGTVIFEDGTKKIYERICDKGLDGYINNVVIPEGVQVIEDYAIDVGSGELRTITIPSTVTTIGKGAISGNNLTTIVNKTKKEFDWNYVLRGVEGTPFETGTVTSSSGKNIIITK